MPEAPSDRQPDAVLVVRAQRGDRRAVAALIERYQDRIFNLCSRMSGNHADAEDLTQSTFLRAIEALPRFEARSSFYTWLFRIAANVALSARRAARLRIARPLEALEDESGGLPDRAAPGPPTIAADAEAAEQLTAALPLVDEEFRAALLLKDVEDLDYATIAEILEVPIGTVKSRIHRGRMMLRELLLAEEQRRGRARA